VANVDKNHVGRRRGDSGDSLRVKTDRINNNDAVAAT
jgi:hypothetical protein